MPLFVLGPHYEGLPCTDSVSLLCWFFVITWYSPAPSQSLNQPWFEGDMVYAALAQCSEPSMCIFAITETLILCIFLFLHWLNYFLCNFVSKSQTRVVWMQFRITWGIGLQTTQPLGNSLPQAPKNSVLTCLGGITPHKPEMMQSVPEKLFWYKVPVCSNFPILCTPWILLFHHLLISLFCSNIS